MAYERDPRGPLERLYGFEKIQAERQALQRQQAMQQQRDQILREAYQPAEEARTEYAFDQQPAPQQVGGLSNIMGALGIADAPQMQTKQVEGRPASLDREGAILRMLAGNDIEGAESLNKVTSNSDQRTKWFGLQEGVDEAGNPVFKGMTTSGLADVEGFKPKAPAPKPNQTREFEEGEWKLTQEWDGSNWKTIARAPRVAKNEGKDKKDSIQTEMGLRKEFNALTDNFREVSRQKSIISQALNQGTAAGDLAAATSIMKMLDPGSVVRESELGMAMNATGALDRVGNYAQLLQNGQRLNPTQRQEFQALANSLFGAAENSYRSRGEEYVSLAGEYGLKPENIVGRSFFQAAPSAPRPAPGRAPFAQSGAPKQGAIKNGYIFMGGNPADPKSWRKL